MATMREQSLAMAARPTALDPPSRSALFSARCTAVSQVGLDLANGTKYSSGALVTTRHEVFISIDTAYARCVLLFDPDEMGDAFLRTVATHGSFTLIPEGQIPVTIDIPHGDESALAAYARLRRWT